MKNFSSKGIRFSGDSIKSCVGFIDLVDSTKNTIRIDNLEYIRKYYSTFINSISNEIKTYSGKIIKNMGDCLLFYFPKTSDSNNPRVFKEAIECCFKILDERYKVNNELARQHLPPFSYRISMDYGVLDLALVGDYSQIDLFGSTLNICSKINSSLSIPNTIIIGENFYRVLKSFSNIMDNYNLINNGEYNITEYNKYSTYSIKKKNTIKYDIDNSNKNLVNDNQLLSYDKYGDKEKKNKNKRIIIVDDEADLLFTYKIFLKDNYDVTSFTEPFNALAYIKELANFENLLIILDIRMKNFNGLQLHQHIKAIDPTIKILFITALDILEELLTIVPGIKNNQILKKPVEKQMFINTINKLFSQ
ncbi:MAG TPA: response regulator [Nitrososphaeraceae archaeon]|nr:response regulator [Nitrososphaeraceae archaeon]